VNGLGPAVAAEWHKVRTLPAVFFLPAATLLVSAGLGGLVALSFRLNYDNLPPDVRERFDPLFATFYSLTLGQLPLVVLGVLIVGSEYASGTIRASLVAVPRRGVYYSAKLLTGGGVALGIAVVTVPVTFFVAQPALGPHATSLRAGGVLTAVVGSCLYLTLIGLLSIGVATMLRSSVFSLAILLPLFLLGSQGLANVPKLKTVTQYLPDAAGMVIMHLTGPPGDPRFGRPYGPWTGLGILTLWTASALVGGYAVLRRRDAS
jgi:ABC-2 type transport system permease protein